MVVVLKEVERLDDAGPPCPSARASPATSITSSVGVHAGGGRAAARAAHAAARAGRGGRALRGLLAGARPPGPRHLQSGQRRARPVARSTAGRAMSELPPAAAGQSARESESESEGGCV